MRWQFVNLGTCVYEHVLLWARVCRKLISRASGPYTCHKNTLQSSTVKTPPVVIKVVQSLAAQRGYMSDKRLYSISSAKLDR